jgi:hypothetical protein
MNFCQSDIPGASLNRRLPAYETYLPHFDATRLLLRGIMHSMYRTGCISCILI